MKLCRACGQEKPLISFYSNPRMPCKPCQDALSIAWRKRNVNKSNAYCKIWYNNMSNDPIKYAEYRAKKRLEYNKRKLKVSPTSA